ncbi:MAG: alpha/beta fold hydrolase [Chitinophagaceae bacterium]
MNKEFLYQNKKIFYRIIGSGKPVVLIHGFGEDGNIWRPPPTPPKEGLPNTHTSLFENSSLTSKFKFIIPDLPGSGKSEMIEDMSIEGMAKVIMAIMKTESEIPPSGIAFGKPSATEGGGGTCIIGHSMGGYITLALAEKYPNHISAFGLFHSTADPDTEEKKATRRKGIAFIRQHGAFKFLKTATPNLFSQKTKDKNPKLINEFIAGLNNFSPEALVSYYEAMMARPDRTKMLQKATVPVLFIMGKYDNAVPLEDGLQQCHLPEKSYIYILRNSGHMGMLEEKDVCNMNLEKFLREILF